MLDADLVSWERGYVSEAGGDELTVQEEVSALWYEVMMTRVEKLFFLRQVVQPAILSQT